MNLHARNLKKPEKKKIKRNLANSETFSVVPMLVKMILIGGAIFFVVNLRISYSEKTEELNREAVRIKKKIHKLNREIQHLKIKKEELSRWNHISGKINDFRLGLRSPEPGQVKALAIVRTSAYPEIKRSSEPLMVSKR